MIKPEIKLHVNLQCNKATKTLIYSSYAIYTHLGKTDSN